MPVDIENLCYTYNPKTVFQKDALKNITLKIDDGEYMGIIGHTGSGKSTLVLHLNGLLKLSSGKIIINGIDLGKKYDYKKLRSTVGLVFQYPEYQLFDETVYKDIAFGPKNLGLSKEEINDRVNSAMELVGLDWALKERSPFELSGGQKRRAALAGVIAMRPKILILDEPTAGLDPQGKKAILDLVRTIKKTFDATIIMISHNMDEVYENCSKIAVLNGGELMYYLTPKNLSKYQKELEAVGLEVPTPERIAAALNVRGLDIPDAVTTRKELIDGIISLFRRKQD